MAVARQLAGRGRPLPPIAEQQAWETKRTAEKGGGKDYYSIAPDYQAFLEHLRVIAGQPAPGTTGRFLPKFDPEWLKIWTGMVGTTKVRGFEEERARAEGKESRIIKAKLYMLLFSSLLLKLCSILRGIEVAYEGNGSL